MDPTEIQAITFDAAGTLIELAEPVGHTYARVAFAFGFQLDPEDTDREFRAAWKRFPAVFATGAEHYESEKDWWRDLVREVFTLASRERGPMERFEDCFEELYDHFATPGIWLPVEGAAEAIRFAAERVPCALLSNFDERLRPILDHLGMLEPFHHEIISSEVRACKPDARIFAEAASRFGIDPGRILHVGDDPHCDWHGAENAGFQLLKAGREFGRLDVRIAQLSLAP